MISSQSLYDMMPPFIQNILLNIYSGSLQSERYGKEFKAILAELSSTQWYNKQQIEQYQLERLKELVLHCYQTVPYYTNLFDSIKLKPSDIRSLADIQKIPILTKQTIIENQTGLISTEDSPRSTDIKFGGTSGTTGTPLKIGWDRRMRAFNNACDWRQKEWAGIKPGDPIALFLGRPIINPARTCPPYWQHDRFQNFLWMSAFHLSEANFPLYIDKLKTFKPKAVEGYPSTLFEVSKAIISSGEQINVSAVFSSSEPLYEHYREVIETAFNCKVFDFYGLAERTIFATQCSEHQGHHLNFEYGITEIVDDNDQVTSGSGYLVTTSLQNYGMPLLRYKVSDKTSIITEKCNCGRSSSRIQSISTKDEDMIYKVDGTPISPSILTHPFKPITSIKKSQIIQTASNCITIKIIKSEIFSNADQEALLSSFSQRVGSDMKVRVEFLDEIPRENSGKFKWVIGLKKGK